MGKRTIYVKLDEELVEEIDKMRKTPLGEIERSEYIENILRKYVEARKVEQ